MSNFNYGNMPFIELPTGWRFKPMQPNENMLIYFAIAKESVPIEVGICVSSSSPDHWEIGPLDSFNDGSSRIDYDEYLAKVPIMDTIKLLSIVEKVFQNKF